MREHMGLYRGKRTDNGEWVQGTPFFARDCCKMITAMAVHPDFVDEGNVYYAEGYPVDPETVGECTGLRDKNGKLIFEGDVCLCDRNINDRLDRKVYEIKCEPTRGFFGENFCEISADEFYMAEIIGTTHDNPELLKGERND